jgi:cytochrome c-type biogenesis protein CcmH
MTNGPGLTQPRRLLSVHVAILAGALMASAAALAFVAAQGPEQPRTLPDRVGAVASTLRCPVCQNLSVADSPSPLARQMRTTIGRELSAGRTPDQIRAGFVQSYGEWILLSPPRRGLNLVVWIAPALLLLGGIAATGFAVGRWTRAKERASSPAVEGARTGGRTPNAEGDGAPLSADDRVMLDRALAALPEEPA